MIHIESNGSRWAGEKPVTIDDLLAVMAREPLCPSFLHPSIQDAGELPYEGAARKAVRNPKWLPYAPNKGDNPEFIDGEPIHPEAPEARRFFGNFANVSHVFCIDTDEPEVIERLRAAIAANMATPEFQAERNRQNCKRGAK